LDTLSDNVLWHKLHTLLHMYVPLTSNKLAQFLVYSVLLF
jgi:hypothetical protein